MGKNDQTSVPTYMKLSNIIIVIMMIKKGCEAAPFRESVYAVGPTDSLLGRGEGYLQKPQLALQLRWSLEKEAGRVASLSPEQGLHQEPIALPKWKESD